VTAAVDIWTYHPHPEVWSVMLAVIGLYLWVLRRVGPTKVVPGEAIVTRRQMLWFGLGLAALWIHADWPIHDIAENYLYSVHMIQHVGFTLIGPPLLLLGMPAWMTRWLFVERPRVHAVARRVLRPFAAAVVYNVVTVLSHWPVVVDTSLNHHSVHFLVHCVMFFSACAMWFPVINRVPELPTMGYPLKMLYLFIQSILPTVPASFLTFGDTPLYHFYVHVPHPYLSVIGDQQLAGALMKIYAGTLIWIIVIGVFFKWNAAEEQDHKRLRRKTGDPLTWDDVQRELERTAPSTASGTAPSTTTSAP
jgi:putative membrane protein